MANNIVIPINKTVDISKGTLYTTLGLQNTHDQLIQGQSYANVLNVSVYDGAEPVALSGGCMGYFVLQQDGSTVTVAGTISGNVASVEFPSFVYAYTGRMTITLNVGGTALVQIATTVRLGSTFVVVDPGNVLPNLDEIQQIMLDVENALNQLSGALEASQAATQAANTAAGTANTAATAANKAAGNATTATRRANTAAASIEGLTVEASDVAYNQPATATVTDVEGHKHIAFGLRQGVPGAVPSITFTGETGEPNTDVVVTQSGPPEAPVVNLKIPQGVPGTGNVSSVDGVVSDTGGNVPLSAVRYVAQTLQPAQQQQARANIGAQASLVHNYAYDGQDLSQRFTAAELHQKVSSGDFSGIQNGDYWPITLTGSFKDYATGQSKTLNNAQFKLEVNINVYINYSDTLIGNHILFCSRDLLCMALQMRSDNNTWYDDTQSNPWLGSALYQTLNASDGVLPLVSATDIGAYIYTGPNGKGMRFLLESKSPTATSATNWEWGDRGKLFLPVEREVWGQDIYSEHIYSAGGAVQWPIFAGTLRHISKGIVNNGIRYPWWCQSTSSGSAASFTYVNNRGYPDKIASGDTWPSAPLCFLFV